jgi:hypothetical protein
MAAVTGSIEERRFVVMRFARIKTWSHVYHVRRHNTREMECRHLEKDAPPPRLIIGTADVAGSIRKVLDCYGVVPKAGEVLALEFVVSTSREVFDGLEGAERDEKVNDVLVCTLRAFGDRFKIKGQLVSVALHEDERTPHLHLVVVPLVCEPDNRRKDRTPIYRLSAKRIIGGRGDMSREQTRFASFFAEMGLERGKERSGARHVSNREHEAMLERARQAALAERQGLTIDRQKIAEAAIQVGNDRDALAAERAELEAERIRLCEEEQRLAGDRAALAVKEKEAEALKRRAFDRMHKLRELLVEGKKLRAYAQSVPLERRSPEMRKAHAAAVHLAAATQSAAGDDAWIAAATAFRAGKGTGAAR